MSRLIDADDIAYESIDSSDTNRHEYYYGTGIIAVRKEDIDDMPTIEQPEQRWIPVTERLPEDDTEVVVSCTDDSGDSEFSYTTTGWHFKGLWVVGNERSYFVRAWQPLPEPWKGEDNERA